MNFLSKTTFCDNDIELNEIQQLSANSLLGNPTGSTANVGIITLANGVTFDGTTLKVKTNEGLTSSGLDLSVDGLRIKLGGGISGSGLNVTVNGLELSVNSSQFSIQSNQLVLADAYNFKKATGTITGNGSATVFDVTHNLNTKNITCEIYDTDNDKTVLVETKRKNLNEVTITFKVAPANLKVYGITIIG